MQEGTLILLYFAAGVACGGIHYHRCTVRGVRGVREIASSATLVVLWPLWAPFAMSSERDLVRGPLASRIALSLERIGPSGRGSDAGVLDRNEISTLMKQVEAAERRLQELDAQISSMKEEPRILAGAGPDTEARARIRSSSITQLEKFRAREHTALVDLAEVCDLLRAQRLVSRFGGAAHEELRDELWARVQALSVLGSDQF